MYIGQQYEVKTGSSEGLNLRRQPTTKGGKTNIILSMPNGTIVTLESVPDPDRVSDGHTWYNIRYTYEEGEKEDEIGWAASDYLLGVGLGGPPPEYTFMFNGKKYKITKENLDAAAQQAYIFHTKQPNSQEITINKKKYYTTQANIGAMKDPARKWIT